MNTQHSAGASVLRATLAVVALAACSGSSLAAPDTAAQADVVSKLDVPPQPTGKFKHVLMISIDGFHAADLERYIQAKPQSSLAALATAGIRYANASAPFPSDSFPSVLAWATGGTPRSTGVFYDISYDRTLSPPGSDCTAKGAQVDFSEVADMDSTRLDGGGGFDPARLPRDPAKNCTPVYPHAYLRVNDIFEVVKKAGLRTAWSDKHLTYEVLLGPSGAGVDDLFNPEIAAVNTKNFANVTQYDQAKVDVVVNQIHGKDHLGQPATVPALFGMNFQAVSVVQKSTGYKDAAGTPTDALMAAMDFVDQSLGTLVTELKAQNLWTSTLFIISASHGQSPIDPALVQRLPTSLLPGLVEDVQAGLLAQATQDTVALLWLKDQTQTAAVAKHLLDNKDKAAIDHLVTGADLVAMFGDPTKDARIPDIAVVVKTGTIYTDSNKKVAEHGGFSKDDRNVALLVLGAGSQATPVADSVETRQIAATIVQALGLDPQQLQAVAKEGTLALPGLALK